ncbi:MAG TPA: ATP-dependent DNA ligase [Gemmatimonadales bacterium]
MASLVETSLRVAATAGRRDKVALLAEFLSRVPPAEIQTATAYLCGIIPQRRLGVGFATLRNAAGEVAAEEPTVELSQIDSVFQQVAAVGGKGSAAEKRRLLAGLLARLTRDEQRYLFGLVSGEVRHGALEGVVTEAVALAAGLSPKRIRRAVMMAGDLTEVARAALQEGETGLSRYSVQLFRPVQPMLAGSADDETEALDELGEAALEWKVDGARVQIHKAGDEVRVYSRALNDVTAAVPEVVDMARSLPARELIVEGEVIALRADGTPLPFQTTMTRFGRRLDVDQARQTLPVTPLLFDLLYLDGTALLDEPYRRRFVQLGALAPEPLVVPRLVTGSRSDAAAFLATALERGHEGIMAKALDAAYESGRRGRHWLKIKPVKSLDLVVLAAEWGHGRRQGWLSNLHLGARNPVDGGFVMLGKTFKGMTDEMLAWQTTRLLELEAGRDAWTVYVRPELVVEVAFNDVQTSTQYPGGVALRFARIKRYRTDKNATDADTIDQVRKLLPQ